MVLRCRCRVCISARLCKPLRRYDPVTTRCKYVLVSSLMSSLTSNGRIRDVPTQRQILRVADSFASSSCGVYWWAGGQGCADRRLSGMKTASLQGRTCSVSARPCTPARPGTGSQQGRTNAEAGTYMRRDSVKEEGQAVSNEELFFKGPRRRSACQRKGAAIS